MVALYCGMSTCCCCGDVQVFVGLSSPKTASLKPHFSQNIHTIATHAREEEQDNDTASALLPPLSLIPKAL